MRLFSFDVDFFDFGLIFIGIWFIIGIIRVLIMICMTHNSYWQMKELKKRNTKIISQIKNETWEPIKEPTYLPYIMIWTPPNKELNTQSKIEIHNPLMITDLEFSSGINYYQNNYSKIIDCKYCGASAQSHKCEYCGNRL